MTPDRQPQTPREWAELIASQFEVDAVDALEEAFCRGQSTRTPNPDDKELVERDLSVELEEAANVLDADGDYDLRDAVREAATRISTLSSRGAVLRELLRKARERIAARTCDITPLLAEIDAALSTDGGRNG